MPSFPRPAFAYAYGVATEVAHLRAHRRARAIPARRGNELLIATWNIANFGEQLRRDSDHQLLAEILSWFDIVALQEVKDNFGDLEDLVRHLGPSWAYAMSDPAGNNERMAYVFRPRKVKPLELSGEIAVPPSQHRHIKIQGIRQTFKGFDRNPYLMAFQAGRFTFVLANVHLYYGSNRKPHLDRRALETFAVARWAGLRQKSRFSFTRHVIALGDFNMPAAKPGDPIYDALAAKGLQPPQHSSRMGSNLAGDKHYDQVVFFAGETTRRFTGQSGVFDFDTVIFPDLWTARGRGDFNRFVRYYVSDHRPIWVQFDTT